MRRLSAPEKDKQFFFFCGEIKFENLIFISRLQYIKNKPKNQNLKTKDSKREELAGRTNAHIVIREVRLPAVHIRTVHISVTNIHE